MRILILAVTVILASATTPGNAHADNTTRASIVLSDAAITSIELINPVLLPSIEIEGVTRGTRGIPVPGDISPMPAATPMSTQMQPTRPLNSFSNTPLPAGDMVGLARGTGSSLVRIQPGVLSRPIPLFSNPK